ncbi:MAG: hypothetical protein K2K53_11235, partial [Oscillospiraceae bacterium]|nr:hypothetical protein [Oscillospiraceae bacterium]
TYTITISDKAGGNYDLSKLDLADRQADFSIGQVPQEALVINGKPSVTNYGDSLQLSVSGGSGTGAVTWEVSGSSAALGAAGADGKVPVTLSDIGDVTVTVKKAGDTNYLAAEAEWTFTVAPKPVTAVVEGDNKGYDGKRDATVKSAAIADDDLVVNGGVRDTVVIDKTSIKAAFDTASAGTGKTVTLDSSKVKADAAAQKYAISYPGTVTADIAAREVALTITLSDHDLETDITAAPKYYYTFNDSERKPNASVTAVATDNGDSFTLVAGKDYTVGYNKNKNVGVAEVIIENVEGGNFDFADETVNFEIRKADAGLTSTPQANDLTYNGALQDLVSVGTATGGTVVYTLDKDDEDSYSTKIPQKTGAGTYTVYYKVQGDGNHNDAGAGQVSVTIKRLAITPVITLSGAGLTGGPGTYSYEYDGNAKTPAVTITGGVDANPIDATTEYIVSYRNNTTAGTATVIVSDKSGGNYIVNGTLDFEITKAAPTVTPPEAINGLQYSGSAQELIEAGQVVGGTMLYSLTENGTYSTAVPTGTAVGKYTVWYKVQGDPNHQDTAPARLDPDADADVEIGRNQVNNPTITLSSDTFKYNGSQKMPTIEVKDDKGRVIPETEYETDITPDLTADIKGDAGIVNAGTYKITITTPAASNYDITGNNTRTFEIKLADQETVTITGTQTKVQYGDVIQLGATGGIGGSTLKWEIEKKPGGGDYDSVISGTGLLTVKDVGGPIRVKVTRTVANYGDVSAVWEFNAVKRPVTAVVTADDRAYDAGNVRATVNVTVPSGVVFGDTITINGLTGTFEDDRVGTNKKVTIGGGTIDPDIKAKYDVTIPKTTTATIWAEAATVDTDGKPGLTTLTYDASQSQGLVTPGKVTGGIMVYSLDGSNFTPSIPKAKDAGTYKVYFKAQGDSNHTDGAFNLAADFVTAEIKKQEVTFGPGQIELSEESVQYDGNKHQPTVTILDGTNNVVPASEYTVTYDTTGGKNWIDQGAYTVKITNRTGGSSDNYIVNDAAATFTITTTPQNTLTITDKPGRVYYGDTFTLSTSGGSGSEAVEWAVEPQNSAVATVDENGTVTIKGVGQAKIVAKKPGGGNYADATAEYPLNALKKPVTVTITAEDRAYVSGDTTATLHVTWNGLLGTDSINTDTLQGTFNDDTVGNNKTVTISTTDNNEITDAKYEFTIPAKTTASIYKADQAAPGVTAEEAANLVYTGLPLNFVKGGIAGSTLYSDKQDGVYSSTVPTGTNAGTYTVWYKAAATATHNESEAKGLTVEISRKELTAPIKITLSGNDLQDNGSGNYSYVFDGSEKMPTATVWDGSKAIPASEFEVSYSKNKNVGTDATVTITSKEGGNYTFDGQTVTFAITSAEAQLASAPQARDLTFIAGQAQALVTGGAANGGHIEYSLDGTNFDPDIPTETNAGLYTVTYKVVGDDNYADSTKTWTVSVTIKQKEVTNPVVALKASSGPYTYDGTPKVLTASDVEVKDGSTVIPDTEYTVSCTNNVDAGTATIRIVNADGGDYIVSGTGTFTIAKADVSGVTPPAVKTDLPYNGTAQELATPGSANGGTMVYSLSQNGPYSPAIPTGTAVGSYDIWYKVEGDNNHNGTTAAKVDTQAAIIVNQVTAPTIQVTPEWVTFNGERQEPAVIVKDDNGIEIDGSEYTVTFTDKSNSNNTDLTQAGTYSLAITATSKGNYDFTGNTVAATFEIVPADQTALTITGTREHVYYGDKIWLGTAGGSDKGTVSWKAENPDGTPSTIAEIDEDNGQLTIKGTGSVKITAASKAAGYNDKTATWSFFADPKPVTAVVTAASRPYNSTKKASVTARLQENDLVTGDSIVTITLEGEFEDENVGTNKKVTVKSSAPAFDGDDPDPYKNYSITYPATTTASIFKANIADEDVT